MLTIQPPQDLRQRRPRTQRRQPGHPARHVRPARAQRCRQVVVDAHAGDAAGRRTVKGQERVVGLDDWIDVGVFARAPSGHESEQPVLYLRRHHVRRADLVVTVIVDAKPYEAGLDPYNKLIDRVATDNRRRVSVQ